MNRDIVNSFAEYFEMVPAFSEPLKNEVYKLRYQVFCAETGIFDSRRYPDGLEHDQYDKRAVHYLIRHRKSGLYAASTRLILPDPSDFHTLFPIEVPGKLDNFEVLKKLPRDKLAEVSRFCVSKEFKKRKNEAGTVVGIGPSTETAAVENERRSYPHITIALIASLIKMSDDHNIHYWFAAMEPALLRFLATLGIHFTGIGPMADYHGLRLPCVIKISDLLDGVAKKNDAILEMLTNSLPTVEINDYD